MWLSGTELVWRAGRDEILGAKSSSHGPWTVDFLSRRGEPLMLKWIIKSRQC